MDTGRDLACAELWQASLERSLARRGRPTRSSLELFHLQPERDLSRVDVLRESAMYSQLRRSAASRRPSMALPSAGGISALALLAATTLPALLGGRGGSVRTARVTYKAGEHGARLSKATVAAATASAAAKAATVPATATRGSVSAATVPAYVAEPRPALPPVHASRPAPVQPSHAAVTTAHIAAAGDATGGAASGASSVSGGAAPAAERSVAAANTQSGPGGSFDARSSFDAGGPSHPRRPQVFVGGPHGASTPVSPTVHRVSTSVPHPPAPARRRHTGIPVAARSRKRPPSATRAARRPRLSPSRTPSPSPIRSRWRRRRPRASRRPHRRSLRAST